MILFWAVFLFIVGAAMGSFVGALVYRLRKGGKFWRGFWRLKGKYSHSVCEKCGHQLGVGDLIPIFSWVLLKGKCRYCHKPISWTALLLEVGVGAAFVLSFLFWPGFNILVSSFGHPANYLVDIANFVLWLVAVVLMAALLVYDARWRILPNKLMWPLIGVASVMVIINLITLATYDLVAAWAYMSEILLAMIPVFGVYLVLYLISRGAWVGFGDVKFGVAVALILADWRLALAVLASANILGSLFVLPQLVSKKLHANSQIAFGPFLIMGTFLVFLLAPLILRFIEEYLSLS